MEILYYQTDVNPKYFEQFYMTNKVLQTCEETIM